MKSHKAFWTIVLLLVALGIGGNPMAAAEKPDDRTITAIEFPSGTSTAVLDINPAGEIVGSYNDAKGTHGFLLSRNGDFISINFPGAVFTRAAGINPRGDIVGRFCATLPCVTDGANTHGFRLSEGEFTSIDFPGARGTNAWKINPRGDIVGSYINADGKHHVYLLSDSDFTTIDVPGVADIGPDNGGINPSRDIIGIYCDSAPCRGANPDAHGFLLSKHGELTTIDFPGAIDTNALAINARGDIVGVYDDATGTHGFLLSK